MTLCSVVAGQGVPSDVDARSRNPLGYILAADMINLAQADPVVDASFRAWISSWLPQVRTTHTNRPNNQGLFAGATRVAADVYLGDAADEALAWDIFRRWLGEDTSPYLVTNWGGGERFTAWQAEDFPKFVGINRKDKQAPDCTGVLRNVDGALWNTLTTVIGQPASLGPAKTNYAYTALQGALVQSVIHYRRGRDPWTIPEATFAMKRAYVWLRDTANHPVNDPLNNDCDLWQAHIANRLYPDLNLFVDPTTATEPGFQVGYSDWTTQCSTWP